MSATNTRVELLRCHGQKGSKRHRELCRRCCCREGGHDAAIGELHRLLKSRKGSFNATYRKNTDANDKAYDLNQKSIQALDALTKEHVDFEATVANVTSEHEAGYVLHAATLEVTEELERTPTDQGRLQNDLDCSSDALTAATKEFTDCWAAHEATGVSLQPTCSS